MAAHPGLITCVFAEPFEVKGINFKGQEKLKEKVFQCMKDLIQNASH